MSLNRQFHPAHQCKLTNRDISQNLLDTPPAVPSPASSAPLLLWGSPLPPDWPWCLNRDRQRVGFWCLSLERMVPLVACGRQPLTKIPWARLCALRFSATGILLGSGGSSQAQWSHIKDTVSTTMPWALRCNMRGWSLPVLPLTLCSSHTRRPWMF